MALEIGELAAAWPEEPAPGDELRELIAKLSARPMPVATLSRLWSLGALPAKIALAYFAYWVRTGYRSADENERRLNETHLRAALELLETMGYMRGMTMKVGQLLAAYPNLVPKEFVEALGRLHFDAPPMHYSLLREMVRNELRAEPEEVFAEFDQSAFAAASLGQVHRARLKSGELAAVKIQYPNIARTIQTDIRNLLALMTPMRLSKDWDNIRTQWEDIRQMLEWETDYQREAAFLKRARAVFPPDDDIVVPRVYEEFSTRRVLTMEYLDGRHLDAYLATNPPQADRNRFGTLMMRASFRIAHTAKFWYADPSPGNYLFLRDGRLGVIDFGCCREFTDEEWTIYKELGRAHRKGGETFRRALIQAAGLSPEQIRDEKHVKLLEALGHWYSDYLLHQGPFDFGDEEFIRRGIELMAEIGRHRYFQSLPMNIWIGRTLIGLRAIAHRLAARIDMKTLNEQESQGILV